MTLVVTFSPVSGSFGRDRLAQLLAEAVEFLLAPEHGRDRPVAEELLEEARERHRSA